MSHARSGQDDEDLARAMSNIHLNSEESMEESDDNVVFAAQQIMKGVGQQGQATSTTGQGTPSTGQTTNTTGQVANTTGQGTAPPNAPTTSASGDAQTSTNQTSTVPADVQVPAIGMHPYSFHSLPGSGLMPTASAAQIDLTNPSSHPVIVTNSRRKRQRRRRQDKPRTVIVPDLHNPSNSLPVKLNKKQLGKLISHLMTMQNEDDSSDDEDDAVDSSGNYSKGRLTVVPSTWLEFINFPPVVPDDINPSTGPVIPHKVDLPPGHPLLQLQKLGFSLQSQTGVAASQTGPTQPQSGMPQLSVDAQISSASGQVSQNLQPLPTAGQVPPPPVQPAVIPPMPAVATNPLASPQVPQNLQPLPTAGQVPPPPVQPAVIPPMFGAAPNTSGSPQVAQNFPGASPSGQIVTAQLQPPLNQPFPTAPQFPQATSQDPQASMMSPGFGQPMQQGNFGAGFASPPQQGVPFGQNPFDQGAGAMNVMQPMVPRNPFAQSGGFTQHQPPVGIVQPLQHGAQGNNPPQSGAQGGQPIAGGAMSIQDLARYMFLQGGRRRDAN